MLRFSQSVSSAHRFPHCFRLWVSLLLLIVLGLNACRPVLPTPAPPTDAPPDPTRTTLPTMTDTAAPTATFTLQPPTLAPSSTATSPSTSTSIPPTPTPTPADLVLDQWTAKYFTQVDHDCHTSDASCWYGATDGYGNDMSLVQEKIDIAEDWTNPTLVFWHKYNLGETLKAEVVIERGEKKETLRSYKMGIQDWVLEVVDLSAYKGLRVKISFKAPDGIAKRVCIILPTCKETTVYPGPSSSWIIQDIRIVPNYVLGGVVGDAAYTPPAPAYASSSDPLKLTLWDAELFRETSQGCHSSESSCRLGVSSGNSRHLKLISSQELYISPQWANPQLAFWHSFHVETGLYAQVEIWVGETMYVLKNYPPGQQSWSQEMLSLQEFKGLWVKIRFFAKDGETIMDCKQWDYRFHPAACVIPEYRPGNKVIWTIEDIWIIPNHQP